MVTIVSGLPGIMQAGVRAGPEVRSPVTNPLRPSTGDSPAHHDPVTVTVARRVSPGRAAEFEDWVDGIVTAAQHYPGFLGSGILRPKEARGGDAGDWHVVYRFADAASLRRWEESPERAQWLARADDLVEETGRNRVSGLETWFAMPGRTAPAPPRWKMFLVTLVAIIPLVLLMNLLVLPHIGAWPLVARTFVFSGTLTGLMTWVVMPRVTRLFRGFLYGRRPAPAKP